MMSRFGLGLGGVTRGQGVGANAAAIARAFTASMDAAASDLVLAILSDSTANDTTDWFYRFLDEELEDAYSTHFIAYQLWNDGSSVYGDAPTYWNDAAGALVFEDTFNRADGSVGTTTSGGQSWNSNAWTIASNLAVASAGGATGNRLLTEVLAAPTKCILEADIVASSTSPDYRLAVRAPNTTTTSIFMQATATTLNLYVNIGSSVLRKTVGSLGLSDGVTYTMRLGVWGRYVWAEVNGKKLTYKLSDAEDAGLTGTRAFVGIPSSNPARLDAVRVYNFAASRLLDVYNGSVAGFAVGDHDGAKLDGTLPVEPDLCIISLGHNPAASFQTPAQYMTAMDTLVDDIHAKYTGVPILTIAENARLDADAADIAERFALLRAGWQERGWGFMDVEAAFLAAPGGLASVLNVDNLHPATPDGYTLWVATAAVHFGV